MAVARSRTGAQLVETTRILVRAVGTSRARPQNMRSSTTSFARAALAGALLFAAACSGAPPDDGGSDYDIDSNAAPQPPAADAPAAPSAAAGDGDAGGGATEIPATQPDAGPGGKTWCATHPATFCADFSQTLPSGFASMTGTFLSLVTGASPGLVVNVPAATSGPSFASRLAQPFTKASNDMTLAFDLAPDRLNTKAGGLLLAALDFPYPTGPAPNFYSVRLAFVDGRARIEEYIAGAQGVLHPLFDVPKGKFSRVTLDVTLGVAGGSVKVSLDGKQVGAVEALKQPAGVDHTPKLIVGAVYGAPPTDGWKFRIANLTMDLR